MEHEAHKSRGDSARARRDIPEAVRCYQRVVELRPMDAGVRADLAYALWQMRRYFDAIAAAEEAIRLDANSAPAYLALGNALHSLGRCGEAVAAFRRALEIEPDHRIVHSNLLLALAYVPEISGEEIRAEHVRWAQRHAPAQARQEYPNDKDPHRRLRIGYISPDLRQHPVMKFLEPILAHHDHAAVEVFCYSDAPQPDALTARAAELADRFRDVRGRSDEQVEQLIAEDRIDILIDLAGHTFANRMTLLARKPAPVQASYLGYPSTTGVEGIDYRITDAIADPPGMTDAHFTERLVRLSRCGWCFSPPAGAPAPAPPPLQGNGFITFGAFTRLTKISPVTLDLWTSVLSAAPSSRLFVKSVDLVGDAAMRLRSEFARRGVPTERVDLARGDPSMSAHLARYGAIDIVLDTFPYAGTTMSCEALWMGVPVVTLAGATHVSRVAASLLDAVGLNDLIAATAEQYVQIASDLGGDPARLRALRLGMRERMQQSPLTDGRSMAQALEEAYRKMWHRYCGRPSVR